MSVFAWVTLSSWERLKAIHRVVSREPNKISPFSLTYLPFALAVLSALWPGLLLGHVNPTANKMLWVQGKWAEITGDDFSLQGNPSLFL